jgi:hypothetical protein
MAMEGHVFKSKKGIETREVNYFQNMSEEKNLK